MSLLLIADTLGRPGGFQYFFGRLRDRFGTWLNFRLLRKSPVELPDEDYMYKLWRLANRDRIKATGRASPSTKITVILNCDEPSSEIPGSLQSVSSQTYENWELLLIGPSKGILDQLRQKTESLEKVKLRSRMIEGELNEIVTFLQPGDILEPNALLEVARAFQDEAVDAVYTDEDRISRGFRHGHFFKPDWSPDLLLSMNYVGHLYAISKHLIVGLKPPANESEYYRLVLETTFRAKKIVHIPKMLYSTFLREGELVDDRTGAVSSYLRVRKKAARVSGGIHPNTTRVRFDIAGNPRVSILIPTYRRVDLLRECVQSVRLLSTFGNYEIIIICHGTSAPPAIRKISNQFQCKLLRYPDPRYAFGEMNNFGAEHANGEYLLFLNDDTKVITPSWIQAMIEWAQLEGVAAVGAKLLNDDNTVNHAGDMIVGPRTFPTLVHPTHAFKGIPAESGGYNNLANVVRNCSCVTAACMMIQKKMFKHLGGFHGRFTSYDDVDLCLTAIERGYRNVYTPYAMLYHYETSSRKGQIQALEEYRSLMLLRERHPDIVRNGDPYYNLNLDPEGNYKLEVEARPEDFPELYLE